jgi:hypothetical protein
MSETMIRLSATVAVQQNMKHARQQQGEKQDFSPDMPWQLQSEPPNRLVPCRPNTWVWSAGIYATDSDMQKPLHFDKPLFFTSSCCMLLAVLGNGYEWSELHHPAGL